MPGFVCGLFVDPATRVGAVALTNATTGLGPADLFAQLIDATTAGLSPSRPTADQPAPSAAVAELAGEWHWGNTVMTLSAVSGGFVLSERGSERRFTAVGTDHFRGASGYFAGEDLTVVRRDDGSISHLEVVTFILTREPYDERAPIPGGPPLDLSSPG